IASGVLVPVLADYPPPEAGLDVVRPPGDFPTRKVRVLTEILIEYFGSSKTPLISELLTLDSRTCPQLAQTLALQQFLPESGGQLGAPVLVGRTVVDPFQS